MPSDPALRAHQEWLGYIQPVGLVVSPAALSGAGCVPDRNVAAQQETLRGLLSGDPPRLEDFPSFTRDFLGWEVRDLAGAPGGRLLGSRPRGAPGAGESEVQSAALAQRRISGNVGFLPYIRIPTR